MENCNNYCEHPGGNLQVPFEKNTVYCYCTILEFTLLFIIMMMYNVTHTHTIAICIDN